MEVECPRCGGKATCVKTRKGWEISLSVETMTFCEEVRERLQAGEKTVDPMSCTAMRKAVAEAIAGER